MNVGLLVVEMSASEGPSQFAMPADRHCSVRHQWYATIAANLIALSHGCIIGWVSPALPILASDATPLSTGPLSIDQVSWVGSINCIGAIVGSLLFGYFTTLLGSKRCVFVLAAPVVAFWLLIYFGNAYIHILIARFIGGCTGGGVQSTIALYVSEIANDEIRGQLGSVTLFARNIGTLLTFILGASVDYKSMCACIFIPFIFGIFFVFLPSTPRYYLERKQYQKAQHAFKYYKGHSDNTGTDDNFNAIYKEFERLKVTVEQKHEEKLCVSDFFTRGAIRGLGIGMALMVFQQASASFAIVNYSLMTFSKVGASIDPHISSITLAVVLLFGSFTTTYLADNMGRIALCLISLLGSACALFITALYHYLNTRGHDLSSVAFIPVVALCVLVFVSAAGIGPLAIICSVENLPLKIRTYGMAIICCTLSIDAFVAVKYYPILLETIDLHGCFLVFGIGSLIGFFFVLFVLKETSGQCLDDVGIEQKRTQTNGESTHFVKECDQKSYNTAVNIQRLNV